MVKGVPWAGSTSVSTLATGFSDEKETTSYSSQLTSTMHPTKEPGMKARKHIYVMR